LKAVADRQREARVQLEQARADLEAARSNEDVRKAEIAIASASGEIEVVEARLAEKRRQHQLSREATESRLAIAREQLKKLLLIQHDRRREHELTRELAERGMESENTARRLESQWKRAATDVDIKRRQIKDLERRMKAGFTGGIAEILKRRTALKRSEGFLKTQLAEARKAREARILKAKAAVKRAELDVDVSSETAVAEQRLEKWKIQERAWLDAIDRKSVRAPISGRLHDLHVQTGETVSHKEAVAIVCGTGRHLFKVGISQVDAPHLRVGQPTHVYLESFPHRRYGAFEGRVETITTSLAGLAGEARAGDARTSCEAWVSVDDPRFDFRVGYKGTAEIVVGRARIAHWLLGLYENDLARKPVPVEAADAR
jgi:multidrug resistance efflux pump